MADEKANKGTLKISKEVAEDQLQLLYDYYDIDREESTGDQKTALQNAHLRLIKAVRKGRLAIEDKDGLKVTQTTKGGDKIEYKEISARAKTFMKSNDNDHKRMYQLLGYLSGAGSDGIEKLKGIDMSISECLGALFLYV